MKTLVHVCESCGRQFAFNSRMIDLCDWCGITVCIYCEPKHEYEDCKGRTFKEKK